MKATVAVLASFLVLTASGFTDTFVKLHDGAHWTWYAPPAQQQEHGQDIEALYAYADSAFEYLTGAWGLKPQKAQFALVVWPKTGGAFATGDIADIHDVAPPGPQPGIAVSYDAFYNVAQGIKGWWAYVLITHEMVNLLTGQIVSGGWPIDWWADHKSPFPKMTAVQVEFALRPDIAVGHAAQLTEPLDRMFVRLKDEYGWALFRRAFRAAVDDGIHWDRLGPNPSPQLTNYVCAYLQMSAPEDLEPILKGVVPDYDRQTVARIMAARRKWRALAAADPRRPEVTESYLTGKYEAVLTAVP
jgi:hypothetical protein